jgi:hypothetical protein
MGKWLFCALRSGVDPDQSWNEIAVTNRDRGGGAKASFALRQRHNHECGGDFGMIGPVDRRRI